MRRWASFRPQRLASLRLIVCAPILAAIGLSLAVRVTATAHTAADRPKDAARPLTVVGFGGALQEAQQKVFFAPFTAATHIAIHATGWDGSLETLQNRARTGSDPTEWDLVLMDNAAVLAACREGLLLPIDPGGTHGSAQAGPDQSDPGTISRCGVGALRVDLVLAWDKSRIDAPPSWPDFWDVARRPGKRGLRRDPRGTLEIALMADGVAADDVYRTLETSEGVTRAFRKLDQLKPYIVWWSTPAQAVQIIEAGAVLMTSAPNGEIANANQVGHRDFGIQWQQSLSKLLSWAIPGRPDAPGPNGAGGNAPAGAERTARIRQLLASMNDPQRQAAFIGLYPAVSVIQDKLPADQAPAADSPATTAHLHDALREDDAFWQSHLVELKARFEAWIGN